MFSILYLHSLRSAEIDRITAHFTRGARILDIGAGTGEQALELTRRGFYVTAIEVPELNYAANRAFPIIDYDGRTIPLPDASVDIVFSSNVLEHVPDLPRMHAEIRRVLQPSGYCIHAMPTHSWRFWTTLSSYPDALVHLVAAVPDLLPHRRPNGPELRRSPGPGTSDNPARGRRHAAPQARRARQRCFRAVAVPSVVVAPAFFGQQVYRGTRRADGFVLHRQHAVGDAYGPAQSSVDVALAGAGHPVLKTVPDWHSTE